MRRAGFLFKGFPRVSSSSSTWSCKTRSCSLFRLSAFGGVMGGVMRSVTVTAGMFCAGCPKTKASAPESTLPAMTRRMGLQNSRLFDWEYTYWPISVFELCFIPLMLKYTYNKNTFLYATISLLLQNYQVNVKLRTFVILHQKIEKYKQIKHCDLMINFISNTVTLPYYQTYSGCQQTFCT